MIYSYTRKTKERTLIPPNNVFYEVNDAHPAHTYSVFTSIYLKTLFQLIRIDIENNGKVWMNERINPL